MGEVKFEPDIMYMCILQYSRPQVPQDHYLDNGKTIYHPTLQHSSTVLRPPYRQDEIAQEE